MRERRRRLAAAMVTGLAVAALGATVVTGALLRQAAPYLDPIEVLVWPLCGAAFAVTAAAVAGTRWSRGTWVLVVATVCVIGDAAGVGLAQRSWAWVAAGAVGAYVAPVVLYLAVTVVHGRYARRVDAAILGASVLLATGLTVAETVLLDPGAWDWCRCVTNPLAVTDTEDAFLLVKPWLTVAHVVAAVVLVPAVGATLARRPGRIRPTDAVAVLGVATFAGARIALRTDPGAGPEVPTGPMAWLGALGLLAVLGTYLARALRRRPSRAHVADLLLAAREERDRGRLQELVSRAIGDPDATVWWWTPEDGTYRDHQGAPLSERLDRLPDGRLMRVEAERHPIAVVVGGRDLPADDRVLEPVAEALRLATENRRLSDELRASVAEIRASRARILAASDETRQRIERDLHDGAQQLLVAAAVNINLASSRLDGTDAEVARTLDAASGQLGSALTELRNLAGGITPTALVHGTLRDAVAELAMRAPVPVDVHVDGDRDPGVEASVTAYFVVSESLANVAKHASADRARVELVLDHPLRVTVVDDGRGGADASRGSGLRGLTDRVEAQGGRFSVESSTGGTTITAEIPSQPGEGP